MLPFMDNSGIQLFINICILLIALVGLQVVLKQWDKRAKAKENKEPEPSKATKPKKK